MSKRVVNGLKIVGDKECPSCAAKGRDSKGNHLIIFQNEEGSQFGKCNRCGHYERPEGDLAPNPRRERSPEEIAAELEDIASYPFRPLTSRRIPGQVAERYGVRVGLSEADGETVVEHYYPRYRDGEVVAYNVRSLDPKGFYYRGSPKGGTDPFGWQQLGRDTGHKKLFIFEDELSCLSGYAILEHHTPDNWKHIKPACISWSAGVGSAIRDLEKHLDYIKKKYQEVIYVHDNDEAGFQSAEQVRQLFPECKFVTTPEGIKDINDLHMAKRDREAFALMSFESKERAPDCAIRASQALEDALAPPVWGKSWPWDGLTQLTYGQHEAEVYGIGGGTGTGKTAIAHEVAAWNMMEHKENVGVCLLEERAGNSLKNIIGKIASCPFHRPDVAFDRDKFLENYEKVKNQLHLWQNKGQNDWDNILGAIRFWAVAHGCKSIFVDNMTTLVNHLSPSEQNTQIARIMTECAGIADELGIKIFMFSHLNPPGGKLSHEEGAEVKESQFTGSRAMQRWCQTMIGFERNKQAEGADKHKSIIRLLKDRNYGQTGIVHTVYDPDTGRLLERQGDELSLAGDKEDESPF